MPSANLETARAAMARNAWIEACERYAEADAAGELAPADLTEFGDAARHGGQIARSIELYERAFEGQLSAGDRATAAGTAIMLATANMIRTQRAAAGAWVRRAEQLLADQVECSAHGRLHWIHARFAERDGQDDRALEHAAKALAIAERTNDRDGRALALVRVARCQAKKAEVAAAMASVDEAMVSAIGGELSVHATGVVYCGSIDLCNDLFDYTRAGEWTDAAQRWCQRKAVAEFPGTCRLHRAELLKLRGQWERARSEVMRATDEARAAGILIDLGPMHYELGELRLRTGDLDGATAAFDDAHAAGRDPQPGLAMLWLARGETATAVNSITRTLAEIPPGQRLRRARMLPAAVEIAIAAGDLARARASADELDAVAASLPAPALAASAAHARGAVSLADGDATAAIASLRRALAGWLEIDAPYELAHTRTLLARAYDQLGDRAAAMLETKTARSAFEKLGATLALRRTAPAADGPLSETLAASGPPPAGGARLAVGDLVDDKFELVRLVGRGGMGTVFEAVNRRTGRRVAVKLLHQPLRADRAAGQRLLQEALACGRIRHPNVVDVYDAGVHGTSPYLVMELLRGESLGARLDREPTMPAAEAVAIVVQAAAGVAAAHAAGIIHRDLKPDNLFLAAADDRAGTVVKVVDFGISKLADRDPALADTGTGVVVGTPFFMSPEQARGSRDIDHRVDIYALGAVLYRALTGRPPFVADNYNALIAAIVTGAAPAVRELCPDVAPRLDRAIARALAREPSARFADVGELVAELRAALT